MIHVDLAVDRREFPIVKRHFNRAGSRRFLYIGHDGWQKNTRYLEQLAARVESRISWIGGDSSAALAGVRSLGRQDFRNTSARRLVADHDFLLTVGEFDANPTTILEAMAWGLVPVCTPTSGYVGYPGIVNVPLNDPDRAVTVLDALQNASDTQLTSMQTTNWHALDEHFNWDRFARQVLEAVDSDRSPAPSNEPLGRKLRLRWSAFVSPYMFRKTNLRLLAEAAGISRTSRKAHDSHASHSP
jgi:glycosyltransferase involved in cell wall biosynthesis